jgi:hypothetical protein
MTPKPVVIGLLLCDRVIVDKDTNSPSAIGIFTGLAVERFPSEPQRFSVLAVLTDAQGDGRGKLAVYRLDQHWLRSYEFVMFVDADEVAHRRVRIYQAPPGTFV